VKRDEALSLNCHDQRLCDLGGTAHNHCVCGLPTLEGAELCGLCRAEGLLPAAAVDSPRADLIWDGRSYPSRRVRRLGFPDEEAYARLLGAILSDRTDQPHLGSKRIASSTSSRQGRRQWDAEAADIARQLAGGDGASSVERRSGDGCLPGTQRGDVPHG
jgi:hypothetical protein